MACRPGTVIVSPGNLSFAGRDSQEARSTLPLAATLTSLWLIIRIDSVLTSATQPRRVSLLSRPEQNPPERDVEINPRDVSVGQSLYDARIEVSHAPFACGADVGE
jgi:hypothetical protein